MGPPTPSLPGHCALVVKVTAPVSHPSVQSDPSGFQQQLSSLIPSGLGVGTASLFLVWDTAQTLLVFPQMLPVPL